MTNDKTTARTKVRFWPGMPTPRSKKWELLLGFFPTWVGLIGISIALLLPLVQSCRERSREQAGQAPPLNARDNAGPQ